MTRKRKWKLINTISNISLFILIVIGVTLRKIITDELSILFGLIIILNIIVGLASLVLLNKK